jgi:hypothetical protein
MMREPTVLQYNNTIQGEKLECLVPPATYLIIHFWKEYFEMLALRRVPKTKKTLVG